jgi:hypothetical protein
MVVVPATGLFTGNSDINHGVVRVDYPGYQLVKTTPTL